MSFLSQLGSFFGAGRKQSRVGEQFHPFDTTGVPTGALVVATQADSPDLRRRIRAALQKQRPEPGMLRVDPLGPALRVSAGPLHPDRWLAWARELIGAGLATEVHLYWLSPLDDADALWTVDAKKLLLQEKAPCEGPGGAWAGPLAALSKRLGADWSRAQLQPPRPARFTPLPDREVTVTPTGALVLGDGDSVAELSERIAAVGARLGHPLRTRALREEKPLVRVESEGLTPDAWSSIAKELSRTTGLSEVALIVHQRDPALEAYWRFREGDAFEHRLVEASTDAEWLELGESEDRAGQEQHVRLNWPLSHLARALGFTERSELL